MAHSSPTLLAFDLGGVLVDVDTTVLARRLERPMSRIEKAFFADGRHEALSVGDLDDGSYIAAAAADLDVDAADARAAWAHVVSVRAGASTLVDQVTIDVIAWSNTDAIHVSQMASALPDRLFRRGARSFSHEMRAAKPDARFFQIALERAGVAAADVLFVDDRAENIDAARGLGIDAHRVQTLADIRRILGERRLVLAGGTFGPSFG